MANRTDPLANSIHGTNPQFLISKIIRSKVYQHTYWKEHCFGLTAESLIDKAVELQYIGGTYGGNRKATPFLCLLLKLLQIQPSKDVVLEYIKNEKFKYLRALGAFYFRLIADHKEVYVYLEPLLVDYRKLRVRSSDGGYQISHMDEFVDDCINLSNMLDIDLPVLPKRETLENLNLITAERISAVEHDVVFEHEDSTAAIKGEKSTAATKAIPNSTMGQEKERRRERLPAFPRDNSPSRSPSRDRRAYHRSGGHNRRSLSSARSSISHERHTSRRYHSNQLMYDGSRRHYAMHSPPPSKHRSSGYRRGHRSRSPLFPTCRSSTRRKERRSPHHREAKHSALDKKRTESLDMDEAKKHHRLQKKELEKDKPTRKGKSSLKYKDISTVEKNAPPDSKRGKNDDSMTVNEWNKVRAELGLKPLQ